MNSIRPYCDTKENHLAGSTLAAFGPLVTYVYEMSPVDYRSWLTIFMAGIPWSVGFSFIALLGQLSRHWLWIFIYWAAIR